MNLGFIRKIQERMEERKVAQITGRARERQLRGEVRQSPEFEELRKKKILEVETRKLEKKYAEKQKGGLGYNILHELGRSAQEQFGEKRQKEQGRRPEKVIIRVVGAGKGGYKKEGYKKEVLGGTATPLFASESGFGNPERISKLLGTSSGFGAPSHLKDLINSETSFGQPKKKKA